MPIPGLGQIPQAAGSPPAALMRPPMPAPGSTGPATAPGAQMGATQNGMAQVRSAIELLQKALPGLPLGSDEHTAVMKAVTDLSKHVGKMGDDNAAKTQQFAEMARQAQQNPNQGMLEKLLPGAGAGPSPMAA